MTGDTSSHLNPSLAVRLPISRSGSRDGVDDFNTNDGDDDIPSTIGGSCSRTHSTTELSTHDPLLLEPGAAGRRRDGGGSYLEPIHVLGKEDEREAVGGRGTSWDARSSPQVTAEVHNSCEARVELQTDVTGEKLGCDSQVRVAGDKPERDNEGFATSSSELAVTALARETAEKIRELQEKGKTEIIQQGLKTIIYNAGGNQSTGSNSELPVSQATQVLSENSAGGEQSVRPHTVLTVSTSEQTDGDS